MQAQSEQTKKKAILSDPEILISVLSDANLLQHLKEQAITEIEEEISRPNLFDISTLESFIFSVSAAPITPDKVKEIIAHKDALDFLSSMGIKMYLLSQALGLETYVHCLQEHILTHLEHIFSSLTVTKWHNKSNISTIGYVKNLAAIFNITSIFGEPLQERIQATLAKIVTNAMDYFCRDDRYFALLLDLVKTLQKMQLGEGVFNLIKVRLSESQKHLFYAFYFNKNLMDYLQTLKILQENPKQELMRRFAHYDFCYGHVISAETDLSPFIEIIAELCPFTAVNNDLIEVIIQEINRFYNFVHNQSLCHIETFSSYIKTIIFLQKKMQEPFTAKQDSLIINKAEFLLKPCIREIEGVDILVPRLANCMDLIKKSSMPTETLLELFNQEHLQILDSLTVSDKLAKIEPQTEQPISPAYKSKRTFMGKRNLGNRNSEEEDSSQEAEGPMQKKFKP